MNAPVLDYLGHPCEEARARERFAEPAATARKRELRDLKRQIARNLHEAIDREEVAGSGLAAALALLPGEVDDDRLEALLTMACAYGIDSSNKLFNLAGQVVALLELVDEAQQGGTAERLLYEHADGRYLVAHPTSRTIAGDPQWHRLGPVEVEADGASVMPAAPAYQPKRRSSHG